MLELLDELSVARAVIIAHDVGLRLIRAARDLDPNQTANIGAQLRASGVPAAVLWGERDEFLSIEEAGRPLAELLGVTLVKLPGGRRRRCTSVSLHRLTRLGVATQSIAAHLD